MAHVLIVEPDVRLGKLYAAALQARQHDVALSTTAQDAILAADRAKPAAVILELQLTAHSGIEFLYEFRSYTDWNDVPVIILSSVPPAEFAGSWQMLERHLGVVAYYYKPHTDLQTIIYAIENLLAAQPQAA